MDIISQLMNAGQVKAAKERLHLSDAEIWELFYECGMEYLDTLRCRLHSKETFDRQFNPFRADEWFRISTFPETLVKIEYSRFFWMWFVTRFWSVCRNMIMAKKLFSRRELKLRCAYQRDLIPGYVIDKIFNDGKRINRPEKPAYAGERQACEA